MSKRLDGIIGCKHKTSSWHLNGFLPDGSNILGQQYNTREKTTAMLYTLKLIDMQGHQTKTKTKNLFECIIKQVSNYIQ